MPQRLYTLFQVADLLGSTLGEVESWISKGWLPCRQMPEGSLRVSEENLVQFLRSQGIDLGEVMSRIARGEQQEARNPPAPVRAEPAGDGDGSEDAPSGPAADQTGAVHPYQAQGRSETWLVSDRPGRPGGPASLPSTAPPDKTDQPWPGAPADTGSGAAAAGPEPQAQEPADASADAEAELPDSDADLPPRADAPVEAQPQPPEPQPAEAEAAPEPEAESESHPEPGAAPAASGSPSNPARQIVDAVLADAVACRAGHVHLVCDRDGLSLRLRIDGVLHEKANFRRNLPSGMAPAVVESLLGMAGLDAAELRRPMRGSFRQRIDGQEIPIVVDTTPTIRGRRIVIHVRDPRRALPRLAELGLADSQRERVEGLLTRTSGMILLAGPPRCGRRTTLRAMAMAMRDARRDVVILDRTFKVEVPGVCQSVIDPAGGFGCAEAIDALARQHPDVLVVGDLHRPDAVQAAVEAAGEGVLVLAAVFGTAARAAALPVEMGADPYDTAAVLLAVIEQRLVRRICPTCRRTAPIPPDLPAGLTRAELAFPVFESPGCDACSHTGHTGRTGLFALLEVEENIAGAIRRAGDAADLGRAIRQAGRETLRAAAVRALREGVTSLVEIERVFGRG